MSMAIFRALTLEDILEEIVGDFTTNIPEEQSEDIIAQQDGSVFAWRNHCIRDLNKEMVAVANGIS